LLRLRFAGGREALSNIGVGRVHAREMCHVQRKKIESWKTPRRTMVESVNASESVLEAMELNPISAIGREDVVLVRYATPTSDPSTLVIATGGMKENMTNWNIVRREVGVMSGSRSARVRRNKKDMYKSIGTVESAPRGGVSNEMNGQRV
jgi:hypothetical protein